MVFNMKSYRNKYDVNVSVTLVPEGGAEITATATPISTLDTQILISKFYAPVKGI